MNYNRISQCESESYEFNGSLDDIVSAIRSVYDDHISLEEAKFITGVLVEKQNLDKNVSLNKKRNEELDLWIESSTQYQDAGMNTPFGYVVLQTSKIKLDAIHLIYGFFLSFLFLGDEPINYLAVLDIELIWLLLTSIKLIKNEDDKVVMAIIIEMNVGMRRRVFNILDLLEIMKSRNPEKTKKLSERQIRESLQRLVSDNIIREVGDNWQLG